MNTTIEKTKHEQVLSKMLQIEKALVGKDAEALMQLLSPDFIGSTPLGQSFNRESYIQMHCTPGVGLMFISADTNSTTIRFYDHIAVVNRRAHSKFKIPAGDMTEYDVQRTEVFLQKDNDWQLVSGQGTRVIALN